MASGGQVLGRGLRAVLRTRRAHSEAAAAAANEPKPEELFPFRKPDGYKGEPDFHHDENKADIEFVPTIIMNPEVKKPSKYPVPPIADSFGCARVGFHASRVLTRFPAASSSRRSSTPPRSAWSCRASVCCLRACVCCLRPCVRVGVGVGVGVAVCVQIYVCAISLPAAA